MSKRIKINWETINKDSNIRIIPPEEIAKSSKRIADAMREFTRSCPLCDSGLKPRKVYHIPIKDKNGNILDKYLKIVKGSYLIDNVIDMNKVRKTSQEWLDEIPEKFNLTILDPDGWDRKNYEFSFHEEKITKEEFDNRLCSSTIQCDHSFFTSDYYTGI
jgi:hypothetical protein